MAIDDATKVKSNNEVIWQCLNCEGKPSFNHKKMMKYLNEVHKIDVNHDKANKTMLSHLDRRDYFTSVYEYEFNGLKFIKSVCCTRSKDDIVRWN